ncbi:MAG TPA: hypothetical protein VLR46_05670 [Candidatus Dormibacteraeota bacterium]|nr:hypothetical protein [Candidatus Dormibacteraeota bacterium]
MRLLRLTFALVCATVALQPVGVFAASSPSPPLNGILAKPAADYVETDPTVPGVFEGSFDAATFVAKTGANDAPAVQQTLRHDGFVDGYWRTWVQKTTRHVLVEMVVAFSGGDGAKSWLTAAELTDKADPNYQHPMSISGIDAYYGAHFFYQANKNYGDVFAFVKGNDYFGVIAVSAKDDLGTTATDQTRAQFESAPDYTIPPAQWPSSNTTTHTLAYYAGFSLIPVLIFVVIVGGVLFIVLRGRRRRYAAVAMSGIPASGVQMSPDGGYWWDGRGWRDAMREVPPTAQRSADGHFWWDGGQWRPVP